VSNALEKHLFKHLRELLGRARTEYERVAGEGSWPGPDPARIGMHMLSGATLLTDSCNAARAARTAVGEMLCEAIRAQPGWELLTAAQQREKARYYSMDCFQHLRNIFLNHGSAQGASHLKEALGDSLKQFSSFERMSTDASQLLRAIYKELHHGGDYAKGKGKEFEQWRKDHCGSTPWLRLERAQGGRQHTHTYTYT
jgi:hypothetical protein